MLKEQCISVTDLRTKTKQYLEKIEDAPKYIFVNNHPIAVLVGISEYERAFLKPELIELHEVGPKILAQAKQAKKTKKSDLVNLH